MLKWCIEKWDENKDKLREAIKDRIAVKNGYDYDTIAELVASHIFVSFSPYKLIMTTGLRSDDRGEACFIFGHSGNESFPTEILMSKIPFESCSVCDALKSAAEADDIDGFMSIAKNIVTNTIKPFNSGWDYDPRFDEIVYEKSEEEANGESL